MTVTTDTNRITYAGDGSATAFPVPFAFFAADELEVIERDIASGFETLKTLTTDYTVAGGGGTVGTVTANAAPSAAVSWTIVRSTRLTQEIDYADNDAFPAETHESGLDRATMIAQDAFADVGRSLKFPKTDAAGLLKDLPSSVERAGKFAAFDSSGSVIATAGPKGDSAVPVSTFMETVFDDTDAATARATLGAQRELLDTLTADGDVLMRDAGAVARLAKGTDGDLLTLSAGLPAWTASPALAGSLAFSAGALTIAAGATTPTRSYHTIDTEGGAATDDLDTIATGSVQDGAILILRAVNAARTVVVRHGVGNVLLADANDLQLDDADMSVTLQRRGANWHEIGRSAPSPWVKIAEGSVTAAASLDITFAPANWRELRFVLTDFSPAAAANLLIRTSTDGGTTYDAGASSYVWNSMRVSHTGAVTGAGSATATSIQTFVSQGTGAVSTGLDVTLEAPSTVSPRGLRFFGHYTAALHEAITGSGYRNGSIDVDGLRFLYSTGNIASGKYKILGLRE